MPHATSDPVTARATGAERCFVLGGFAAAALGTIPALLHVGGLKPLPRSGWRRPSGHSSPRWGSRSGGDCATATGVRSAATR